MFHSYDSFLLFFLCKPVVRVQTIEFLQHNSRKFAYIFFVFSCFGMLFFFNWLWLFFVLFFLCFRVIFFKIHFSYFAKSITLNEPFPELIVLFTMHFFSYYFDVSYLHIFPVAQLLLQSLTSLPTPQTCPLHVLQLLRGHRMYQLQRFCGTLMCGQLSNLPAINHHYKTDDLSPNPHITRIHYIHIHSPVDSVYEECLTLCSSRTMKKTWSNRRDMIVFENFLYVKGRIYFNHFLNVLLIFSFAF